MSASTFETLVRHHGDCLRVLKVTAQCGDFEKPWWQKLNGLECLRLNIYDEEEAADYEWPCHTLISNHKTLQVLDMGVERAVAERYSRGETYEDDDTGVTKVGKDLAKVVSALEIVDYESITLHPLHTLRLCGFDLQDFLIHCPIEVLDFSRLKTLVLESCCDLKNALPLITSNGVDEPFQHLTNLRRLILRNEDVDARLHSLLRVFFCSLRELTDVSILLEGEDDVRTLTLKTGSLGQSLQSLVWDVRKKSMDSVRSDYASHLRDADDLRAIARRCPNLKELGLSLDWTLFEMYPKHKTKVRVEL